MKRILMAIVLVGLTNVFASAQTKVCTKDSNPVDNGKNVYCSKFAQNYPICKNENGYNVCTQEELQKQINTPAQTANKQNDDDLFDKTQNDLLNSECTCSVIHNNIVVSYDDAGFCMPYMQNGTK